MFELLLMGTFYPKSREKYTFYSPYSHKHQIIKASTVRSVSTLPLIATRSSELEIGNKHYHQQKPRKQRSRVGFSYKLKASKSFNIGNCLSTLYIPRDGYVLFMQGVHIDSVKEALPFLQTTCSLPLAVKLPVRVKAVPSHFLSSTVSLSQHISKNSRVKSE